MELRSATAATALSTKSTQDSETQPVATATVTSQVQAQVASSCQRHQEYSSRAHSCRRYFKRTTNVDARSSTHCRTRGTIQLRGVNTRKRNTASPGATLLTSGKNSMCCGGRTPQGMYSASSAVPYRFRA